MTTRTTTNHKRPCSTPCSARYSERLYVRLEPSRTRLFRYLLEAEDNLAYTSVVDRKACLLKVVFAREQRKHLEETLQNMRRTVEFLIVDFTNAKAPAGGSAPVPPPAGAL